MSPNKLSANEKMIAEMRRQEEARASLAAQQEVERGEREQIRQGTRDRVQKAKDALSPADAKEAVEETREGTVRLLCRDGLLWLVQKRRLSEGQRSAAERYRTDYERARAGDVKASGLEYLGGGGDGTEALQSKVEAIQKLKRARDDGLLGDEAMISLLDAVAGKGQTLRDLAMQDRKTADALEVEFRVGCRLLARHYGYAS